MKLLLGILIGLGITFTGVAMASQAPLRQYFSIENNNGSQADVSKFQDGKVVCYVLRQSPMYFWTSISCLVEPL